MCLHIKIETYTTTTERPPIFNEKRRGKNKTTKIHFFCCLCADAILSRHCLRVFYLKRGKNKGLSLERAFFLKIPSREEKKENIFFVTNIFLSAKENNKKEK